MKTLALVVALLSASATAYYADRLNEDGTLSKAARKSKVTGACTQCSASGSYMVHTFLPYLGTARPLPRKSCRMFVLAYPFQRFQRYFDRRNTNSVVCNIFLG